MEQKYNTVCNNCNTAEFKNLLNIKDYFLTKEDFELIVCKNCGLAITYPFPSKEKISVYYESSDYISHSDASKSLFDKLYHIVRSRSLRKKVSLIKKYVPHGTILDFGCGTGYFLNECKKEGFIVFGVETNPNAVANIKNKSIEVKQSIESYSGVQKFDVITLWHVMEHLYNPNEFIETVASCLNDNGYLVLALPNRMSFDAMCYKNYWAGYDVPRHLYHFTKKDVQNITQKHFYLQEIRPMVFDSFYVSMLSEKHKKSSLGFIKGGFLGLLSNISAIFTGEYSSLIYVLKKK